MSFSLQVKHCLEIGISADSAAKLFIFLGLASTVSRVVTGKLCDIPWVNTIFIYQFGDLLVAFMTIALPLLKDYMGILAFAVVYGVGDGIFITTMNSLLMFTVDEKRRAAALGLGSCLLSLGVAGGPPLAGRHVQFALFPLPSSIRSFVLSFVCLLVYCSFARSHARSVSQTVDQSI